MPSGGARNRSGPMFDPDSATSERRGVVLTALPTEGFDGEIPPFPLSPIADRTSGLAERELALWDQVWSSPQACAWSVQPWRWLTVGHYVRLALKVECGASAADVTAMIRLADQIGMTPAGLRENGWRIAEDDLAAKRAEQDEVDDPDDPRGRFEVVDGTGG